MSTIPATLTITLSDGKRECVWPLKQDSQGVWCVVSKDQSQGENLTPLVVKFLTLSLLRELFTGLSQQQYPVSMIAQITVELEKAEAIDRQFLEQRRLERKVAWESIIQAQQLSLVPLDT